MRQIVCLGEATARQDKTTSRLTASNSNHHIRVTQRVPRLGMDHMRRHADFQRHRVDVWLAAEAQPYPMPRQLTARQGRVSSRECLESAEPPTLGSRGRQAIRLDRGDRDPRRARPCRAESKGKCTHSRGFLSVYDALRLVYCR